MTSRLFRQYTRVARRPLIAGSLVVAAAMLLAAGATAARGFPPPAVHDEFAYLLGAETFAAGRLTNPTHPMWRHFETFHVLHTPTYSSKYPPGNSLFLALGIVTTGYAIAGVWMSFAFMCGAVYWMLRAWVGHSLGLGMSVAFAAWTATTWGYSFWGGNVAAGAGALMLGGVYRIVRQRGGAGSAAALGLGVLLLANTRPFEGLIAAIPVFGLLIWFLYADRLTPAKWKVRAVLLPILLVAAFGALAMGFYFKAVTGSWREMPYMSYQKTRDPTPKFLWMDPSAVPVSSDPTIRQFAKMEETVFRDARTAAGRINYFRYFVRDFIGLVIPGIIFVPALLLPWALRSRRTQFAVAVVVWAAVAMAFSTWSLPHYSAPLVGFILIVYGGCLRWLSGLRNGDQRLGRYLTAATVVVWIGAGLGDTALSYLSRRQGSRFGDASWSRQRQQIAEKLSSEGGPDLIIVRYGPRHSANSEWVYNAANIDASPVVWARDKGATGNAQLLSYFRNRTAWLLEVDDDNPPFRLRRYSSAAAPSSG